MEKTALEKAGGFFQKIVDFIILFLGVILFFVAFFMYHQGNYQNCQCLLLILIIFSMRNWKDSFKRRDKKILKEIENQRNQ